MTTSEKQNVTFISENSLSELLVLTYKLIELIENFSHVSDFLPHQLQKELRIFRETLIEEQEQREDIE